jgi:hypothetical protein
MSIQNERNHLLGIASIGLQHLQQNIEILLNSQENYIFSLLWRISPGEEEQYSKNTDPEPSQEHSWHTDPGIQNLRENINNTLPRIDQAVQALKKNGNSPLIQLMSSQLEEIKKNYAIALEKSENIDKVCKIAQLISKIDPVHPWSEELSLSQLKDQKKQIKPLFLQINNLHAPHFEKTISHARLKLIEIEYTRQEAKRRIVRENLEKIYKAVQHCVTTNQYPQKEVIEEMKKTFSSLPKKIREKIGGEIWKRAGAEKINTEGDLHWGENHAFDQANLTHLIGGINTIEEGFIGPYEYEWARTPTFQFHNEDCVCAVEEQSPSNVSSKQEIKKHPQETELTAVLEAIDLLNIADVQNPQDIKPQLEPLLNHLEEGLKNKLFNNLRTRAAKTVQIPSWDEEYGKYHFQKHIDILKDVIRQELNQ